MWNFYRGRFIRLCGPLYLTLIILMLDPGTLKNGGPAFFLNFVFFEQHCLYGLRNALDLVGCCWILDVYHLSVYCHANDFSGPRSCQKIHPFDSNYFYHIQLSRDISISRWPHAKYLHKDLDKNKPLRFWHVWGLSFSRRVSWIQKESWSE